MIRGVVFEREGMRFLTIPKENEVAGKIADAEYETGRSNGNVSRTSKQIMSNRVRTARLDTESGTGLASSIFGWPGETLEGGRMPLAESRGNLDNILRIHADGRGLTFTRHLFRWLQ